MLPAKVEKIEYSNHSKLKMSNAMMIIIDSFLEKSNVSYFKPSLQIFSRIFLDFELNWSGKIDMVQFQGYEAHFFDVTMHFKMKIRAIELKTTFYGRCMAGHGLHHVLCVCLCVSVLSLEPLSKQPSQIS